MIVLENVCDSIVKFLPINIKVDFPSIVKISGANGSGKTSLIKILAGISNEYTGRILINNYNLRYNLLEFKRNTQTIFFNNGLYDDLTVAQNISVFSKRFSGIDLTQATITTLSLEKYKNIKISNLSSGIKRMVALSRLVACPCKIWIIDEIDIYLDEFFLMIIKDIIIKRIKTEGIVFYTSHSDYLSDIKKQDIFLKNI